MSSDSGYIHIYEPATNSDQRTTLLLLHGTGGDENALSGLGRMLLPGAGQLRPRGNVLENGMPRFFRRFAEGVLDIDDLKQRTADLADFIQQASALYGFDARDHCRRFLQRCQYRRQYAAPASPGGARCHLAASHAPFRARGAAGPIRWFQPPRPSNLPNYCSKQVQRSRSSGRTVGIR